MEKNLYIDASHPNETRIILKSTNSIEEYEFEDKNNLTFKNNIYLGTISRVEPSLQAAFVNFGRDRHGFLAFNDIQSDYYQIPSEDKEKIKEAEEEIRESLKNENLEDDLTSVRSFFRRSFEQVRYNPDSRISQRIYSTENLLGMIFLMCKIFQSKFRVNDFYEIIRDLVVIWENQQPLLYDGVNEEDMDTFQFAIGMYEENELYEYSILDSEISTFLNSLELEQIYSILAIMGHPRFRTNRLLAQRINKSEEYARQLKQSTQQELQNFFDNHEETDSEDQEYAIRVISTKCQEMAGINE